MFKFHLHQYQFVSWSDEIEIKTNIVRVVIGIMYKFYNIGLTNWCIINEQVIQTLIY